MCADTFKFICAVLMCNCLLFAVKKRHDLNGRQVEVKKALSKNDMGKF